RQIVNLQTDRIGAGSLNRVDYLDDIAVLQRPRRLNKDRLFDSLIFRNVCCSLAASALGSLTEPIVSWFSFNWRSVDIDTTSVSGLGFNLLRSSFGSRCVGMSALNRLGLSGVTTMKMISSTSSTSMRGVTLI